MARRLSILLLCCLLLTACAKSPNFDNQVVVIEGSQSDSAQQSGTVRDDTGISTTHTDVEYTDIEMPSTPTQNTLGEDASAPIVVNPYDIGDGSLGRQTTPTDEEEPVQFTDNSNVGWETQHASIKVGRATEQGVSTQYGTLLGLYIDDYGITESSLNDKVSYLCRIEPVTMLLYEDPISGNPYPAVGETVRTEREGEDNLFFVTYKHTSSRATTTVTISGPIAKKAEIIEIAQKIVEDIVWAT